MEGLWLTPGIRVSLPTASALFADRISRIGWLRGLSAARRLLPTCQSVVGLAAWSRTTRGEANLANELILVVENDPGFDVPAERT